MIGKCRTRPFVRLFLSILAIVALTLHSTQNWTTNLHCGDAVIDRIPLHSFKTRVFDHFDELVLGHLFLAHRTSRLQSRRLAFVSDLTRFVSHFHRFMRHFQGFVSELQCFGVDFYAFVSGFNESGSVNSRKYVTLGNSVGVSEPSTDQTSIPAKWPSRVKAKTPDKSVPSVPQYQLEKSSSPFVLSGDTPSKLKSTLAHPQPQRDSTRNRSICNR